MLERMALSLEHLERFLMICCNLMICCKSAITKTLPNCLVIFSQPTLRVDNGKAALTINRLNEHFSELNIDVVNNSNIKVKHIGLKGLHLNPKGKGRLALNFTHKIRDL